MHATREAHGQSRLVRIVCAGASNSRFTLLNMEDGYREIEPFEVTRRLSIYGNQPSAPIRFDFAKSIPKDSLSIGREK
jgi:uncharacterized protein YsxB (DUF464 family)